MESLSENQQKMINDWKTGYVLDYTEGSAEHWPILGHLDRDFVKEDYDVSRKKLTEEMEIYSLKDLEIVLPFIIKIDEWYKEAVWARPKQVPIILKYDRDEKIDVSQCNNYMLSMAIDDFNKEAIIAIIKHPKFMYYNNERCLSFIDRLFNYNGESKPEAVEKIKFVLNLLNKQDKFMFLSDISNEYKKKKNIKEFFDLYACEI